MNNQKKVKKEKKITIKYYVNTKLKPKFRKDLNEDVYPVYLILSYKGKNYRMKSLYYPYFSERLFKENPIPNDRIKNWRILEEKIIRRVIKTSGSDESEGFDFNFFSIGYKLLTRDMISTFIWFVDEHIGRNAKGFDLNIFGLDFSRLSITAALIVNYDIDMQALTVYEWLHEPNAKECFIEYLKNNLQSKLSIQSYITDTIFIFDKIAEGKIKES